MPCYRPLEGFRSLVRNPNGKRSIVFNRRQGYTDMPIQLPCGKCTGCRLEHSRKWAIRCMHEAQMHQNNSFVTLTYCPEKLPTIDKHPTLEKRHLQLFIKRLRKKYGKGIKYYACGEYGSGYGRPHYHLCIFGVGFMDKTVWKIKNGNKLYTSEKLNKLWTDPADGKQIGWAVIGDLTFQSAAYVARYVMKKRKGKDKDSFYEKSYNHETGEVISIQPEFPLMSRRPGIGQAWLERYKTEVYPQDSIIHDHKELKPPKYYDDLFEKDNPITMAQIKYERKKIAAKHKNDNSLARLKTKEQVKRKQTTLLQRSLENDDENIHGL